MNVERMFYGNGFDSEKKSADELMISNMISVLNNPSLAQMLDDHELKTILNVIKNHVVLKSEMALTCQQRYLDNDGRTR